MFITMYFFLSGFTSRTLIRAYPRPILRSTIEHCLFRENYAKLYLDANHYLEKRLNRREEGRGGDIFEALF